MKKFLKLIKKSRVANVHNWDIYRWTDAGQAFILTTGTVIVLYFAIVGFLDRAISIGSLMFIISTYWGMIGPMFSFMHGVRGFYQAMADFDVLFQYAKIENEVKDLSNAKNYKIEHGDVEFKNIVFGYNEKRRIFNKLSLKVPRHKKVALVGHSGCGKSTLIKLLYRLYDIQGGEILVDGRDIKEYRKEWLRSEMSIVPQECALFDDTIYNNIAFSKPNATRKEVIKAMKFAQLDRIVKNFPDGYKTIVGERGVKLSGGEKQRVSIARAILANKKILVLDEATSSLDSQTEHEIQRDLEKLMKGRTSIIIAHRLSTIMKADFIVVMNKGKIVEIDTHDELVSKKGHYSKLWDLQKGGYDED
jgi:ATP-binding cassette subfamily B protein